MTLNPDPKRIERLHERTKEIGSFGRMDTPTRSDTKIQIESIQTASKPVGREPVSRRLVHHSRSRRRSRYYFTGRRSQIVALAGRHGWPTMYQWREFLDIGG